MPLDQHPFHANDLHIVARTGVPPASLQEPVRRAIRAVNPEIAMKQTTLAQLLSTAIALPRFQALLLGIFASLAVLLAVAGVYGLMSYHVASRSSEFGLRLALGSSASGILRLSLSAGLRLIASGLVAGVLASLALTRFLESQLFGVKPGDLSTYALSALALLLAAGCAALAPSLRAARLDPLTALREE
jgi:ABC-type antimicrobial peptide transport system permease subunit